MPYATAAQMTDRFGEAMLIALTDRAAIPAGVVDTAVLDRALADADAVIDGYLAARYALPLASVPALVSDLAMSLAVYRLHTHEPDAKITRDHEAALRMLRDIAGGTVKLAVAGVESPGTGGTGARATDRARDMTPDSMTGLI